MNSKEIIGSVFSIALKIVIAVIVIMLVYKYAVQAYDYGYRIFGEEPVATGEGRLITVTISDDMDTKEIGQALENKGLIRDGELFVWQEKVSDFKGMIQPGVYELSTAMTAEEMMEVMATPQESTETTETTETEPESTTESLDATQQGDVTVVGSEN